MATTSGVSASSSSSSSSSLTASSVTASSDAAAARKKRYNIQPNSEIYVRRKNQDLSRLKSSDIITLQENVKKVLWKDKMKPFLPLIAW
jgi:hypothetical protein